MLKKDTAPNGTCKKGIKKISKKILHNNEGSDVKIPLHQEQLKISKDKIKTGEISIHREILTEEKNITIPVKREELVIEKNVIDSQFHNESHSHNETIRIPVSEEHIHIHKQPVTLENVSVSNHQYKEIKHVTETLKKEIPHVSIKENVKIADEEIHKK